MTNRTLPRRLAAPLAALLVPLGGLLFATPLHGQRLDPRPTVLLEGYLTRAELAPSMAGSRLSVGGAGARVLRALSPLPEEGTAGLASRLALGGFVTYAPRDDAGLTTLHYGAASDFRLRDRILAGHVEPLLSLGVGAFRTRRDLTRERAVPLLCLRPTDLTGLSGSSFCNGHSAGSALSARPQLVTTTNFAVSPAVALRFWLGPDVAIRADLRDVVVYRGAPAHNLELATGVSFAR